MAAQCGICSCSRQKRPSGPGARRVMVDAMLEAVIHNLTDQTPESKNAPINGQK